eukprot:1392917-Prymnesium_polylepis.1
MRVLPSDFVVLELHKVDASTRHSVRSALLELRQVVSVTRERAYRAAAPQPADHSRALRRPPARALLQASDEPTAEEEAAQHDRMPHDFITSALDAKRWWRRGASGAGIRVAVMDTGLRKNQSFLRHVVDVIDFTPERNKEDLVGHSSFMAGVIGSHQDCLGFAPDAALYMLRVFDSRQGSSTAGFLEAFNYALLHEMDLINLSVGGPDYLDLPFVAKVKQVAMAGITISSGAGNSGPSWGSTLNPADEGP